MLYKECPGSRAVGAVFVSPALQRGEGRFHVRTPESRRDGARTFPLQESIPPGAWSSVPGNNPSQNSWESTNGTKSRQGRRATCSFERARLQLFSRAATHPTPTESQPTRRSRAILPHPKKALPSVRWASCPPMQMKILPAAVAPVGSRRE